MSDLAIKVENISKAYRIGLKEQRHDTLGATLVSWVKSPFKNFKKLQSLSNFKNQDDADIFWALKDINFEVRKGEVLGIIGRNGAGKSTLLKILSRITEPTSGRAEIYGRTASLLEVGTGFNPELTGRENVYLNGTILGMTKKEIDRKFDEIIDFSGVEKFIDTPVKRYSSGMKVRLAFAVAAHLDPEILIIDEVLAVGDVEFQMKCLGKMDDVAASGRTVLFVSHDMGAINELCPRTILFSKGKMVFNGKTDDAINLYIKKSSNDFVNENSRFKIRKILVNNLINESNQQIKAQDPVEFTFLIDSFEDPFPSTVGLDIFGENGVHFAHLRSDATSKEILSKGNNQITVFITGLPYNSGQYFINFWIAEYKGKRIASWSNVVSITIMPDNLDDDRETKNKGALTVLKYKMQYSHGC